MRCFRGNKFITSRIQNKNGYIDADSHRFTGIVFNQGHSALLFPHSKLNGHFVYTTNVPAITIYYGFHRNSSTQPSFSDANLTIIQKARHVLYDLAAINIQ